MSCQTMYAATYCFAIIPIASLTMIYAWDKAWDLLTPMHPRHWDVLDMVSK